MLMAKVNVRRRLRHYLVAESGELTNRFTTGKKAILFVLVTCFLVALESFVNLAAGMFTNTGVQWNAAAGIALAVLVVVLFVLNRFVALQSTGALAVNPKPHSECRALIVFLSFPDRTGTSVIEKAYLDCADDSVSADAMLSRYEKSPWRQPLSAVFAHLTRWSPGKLEYLVVIPSADHPDYGKLLRRLYEDHRIAAADPGALAALAKALSSEESERLRAKRGTVGSVEHFRETVELLAGKLGSTLKVKKGANLKARWQDGVDYEDATSLAAILQDAFNYLENECDVNPRDIMVDITSGNALCSAIGAAVAIDKNRRFQWVSQATGEVLPYEIEYVSPE
jgi:hypothetical protein